MVQHVRRVIVRLGQIWNSYFCINNSDLVTEIKKRRLHWLGHMKRMKHRLAMVYSKIKEESEQQENEVGESSIGGYKLEKDEK